MAKQSEGTAIERKGKFWGWKETLSAVLLVAAGYFFWSQRVELMSLGTSIRHTHPGWLAAGVLLTVGYIAAQAAMYVYSFQAVTGNISWSNAAELFLRRNVVAVFLPGGGLTALAYLPDSIAQKQTNKNQVHHASVIYGFTGIFSVFLVAVPALLYLTFKNTHVPGAVAGFFVLLLIIAFSVVFIRSVQRKGPIYRKLTKGRPRVQLFLDETFSFDLVWKQFWFTVLASIVVEIIGVVHLYISMLAAHVPPSWAASVMAYIIATIFLMISPFLRGLGAIEFTLTFILHRYGYSTVNALLIALLFRFFELWLPLFAGILYYARKVRSLFKSTG